LEKDSMFLLVFWKRWFSCSLEKVLKKKEINPFRFCSFEKDLKKKEINPFRFLGSLTNEQR